ncbi:MAG TPA: fused MFS/spermidine synthase, partial [Gemmataceae bacterium]|nr:fused MFS/spermidine synthase [Gemmataceae bacterium]
TLLLTNVTVAAVLGLMWAPRLLHLAMVLLLPVGVVLVIWETLGSVALPFAEHPLRFGVPIWAAVGLHLTTLFLAAMVCHGELARTRPATRFLTEFYLLLSVGGVLGGLFNALVAPLVFSRIVEYPLVMALALLLLPRAGAPRERRVLFLADLNLGGVLGLIGLLVAAFWLGHNFLTQRAAEDLPEPFRGPATKFARRFGRDDSDSLLEERNFFGLVRVRRDPHDYYHWIVHGTTVHGLQCWGDPDRRKEPLAYFHEAGPMGEIWAAARAKKPNLRVAVLGVGSGTLAAFTRAGDEMTLYEIDPAVVRLVHDKTYFTYIPDAKERGVQVNVELGDGRLRLQQAPEEHFDLIFMDAFTSDAVPVHLLTREAIQTYLTKLAPGGVIIINVANRYLDFEPVFANLATELGLAARYGGGSSGYYNEEYNVYEQYGSAWIVLARNEEDLGQLLRYRSPKGKERWEKLAGREDVGVWTDDYSNLFSVFNWKR